MIGVLLGGFILMFVLLRYLFMFEKIGFILGFYWYENVVEIIYLFFLKFGIVCVFMFVGSEEGCEK